MVKIKQPKIHKSAARIRSSMIRESQLKLILGQWSVWRRKTIIELMKITLISVLKMFCDQKLLRQSFPEHNKFVNEIRYIYVIWKLSLPLASTLDFLEMFLTEHKFIALFGCLKAQTTLKSQENWKQLRIILKFSFQRYISVH